MLQSFFGLINVDCKKFFLFAPASSTRGHCYKLFVEQTSSNCRYHFFCKSGYFGLEQSA